MSPKDNIADERRQQILTAAAACFAAKGYHRTTMDDIVRASGLSKGSLYWYFDSKRALFLALVEHFMAQFTVGIAGMDHANLPVAVRLENIVQATIDLLQSQADLMPLMMEFWSGAFQDDDVQTIMRSAYQAYQHGLSQIIQQGIERGELRSVNAQEVASVLIAAVDGLMFQELLTMKGFDLTSTMRTMAQVTLHGLLQPAEPDQMANK